MENKPAEVMDDLLVSNRSSQCSWDEIGRKPSALIEVCDILSMQDFAFGKSLILPILAHSFSFMTSQIVHDHVSCAIPSTTSQHHRSPPGFRPAQSLSSGLKMKPELMPSTLNSRASNWGKVTHFMPAIAAPKTNGPGGIGSGCRVRTGILIESGFKPRGLNLSTTARTRFSSVPWSLP